MAYDPTAGYPDLATIRSEVGVPATVLSDDQLDLIAGSEQDNLGESYDWGAGDLPDRMYQVFLRSVARTIAARGRSGRSSRFAPRATCATSDSQSCSRRVTSHRSTRCRSKSSRQGSRRASIRFQA